MGAAQDRLNELEQAANEWFSKENTRLEAEYKFLDSIAKKRQSATSLQDLNAEGASAILANSINDYLGKPL